jgi:hypothetical protein
MPFSGVPSLSADCTFKVCATLFHMIHTALLSVRKKLSVAQKYFKCNTAARVVLNVHVSL